MGVKIIKDKNLYIILMLVMLFHGAGIKFCYAVDTYVTFDIGFKEAATDMLLRNGRPIIALIYELFAISGLKNELFYYISTVMSIVLLTASVYVYYRLIKQYISNEYICVVASFATISNFCIIEYFMFIEKGGFMLGILFSVLIIKYLDEYLNNRTVKSVLVAFLLALLCILTYQGIFSLFFILALPLIYKYSRSFKEYLKYILLLCGLYWAPMMTEMFLFRVFFANTRAEKIDVKNNIEAAIHSVLNAYKTSFKIVPTYFYLICFMTVFVVSIISVFKFTRTWWDILNILIIFSVVSILPFASIIAGPGWSCPRIVYPMASGVGVLFVNYYINVIQNDGSGNISLLRNSLCCILVLFLAIQYVSFLNIYIDKYMLNHADKMRCLEIDQAIKEYEAETGNTIIQIAFYYDANLQEPFYPEVFNEGDLVKSAFIDWDFQLRMVNYYLGTNYGRCYPDESYTEYFKNFDWSEFSSKQIVCDYDTLHYCIY